MSTLSEVQALYGSVRNIWAKSQAHILAHVVLVIVVFVVCGATVPEVNIPQLDAKQITDNEWFKLAKDIGLVYASLVLPVIAVAVYAVVLRTLGQVLFTAVLLIFPPRPGRDRFRLLSVSMLEPLALTLEKEDFEISDLQAKANEFALKYESNKSERWDAHIKGIGEFMKDAPVYLGDFLAFVLAWIILFQVTPQAAWTQANQTRFWPVILVLVSLAWFAGFRVYRAAAVVPSLFLISVSSMLLSDPNIAPLLEGDQKDREHVRERLEELLQKERQAEDRRPSLRRFLGYRLGLSSSADKAGKLRQGSGLPFRSLYERGSQFSWEVERHERYDSRWLGDYLAYLFYRFHDRLSNLMRALWQLIRYFVTGAP